MISFSTYFSLSHIGQLAVIFSGDVLAPHPLHHCQKEQSLWPNFQAQVEKNLKELIANNNYNYWLIVQYTWQINLELYGQLWITTHRWCKEWLNSSAHCGGCYGRNTHSGERLAINNIFSRLLSQVQSMNNTFPSHSTYIIPTHSPPPSHIHFTLKST